MEIDKDVLISKVFLKNVVWDNRLKGHSNRHLVDKAWQKIAVEMGLEDDGILRKKWKYLRDQFAVEAGKHPPPRPGDCPESKWPYFKSLTFLLGIVKPRKSSSNLRSNDSSKQQDENVELVDHINNSAETATLESQVSQQSSQPTQQDDPTWTDSLPSEKSSRKRKLSGENTTKYDQQLLTLEAKNTSLLERIMNERGRADDNEDDLFFRSLLPHVSNIPPHFKLRFRNQVQQLVDEFAYGSNIRPRDRTGQLSQYTPESISSAGSSFAGNNNSSKSRAPSSDHSENV